MNTTESKFASLAKKTARLWEEEAAFEKKMEAMEAAEAAELLLAALDKQLAAFPPCPEGEESHEYAVIRAIGKSETKGGGAHRVAMALGACGVPFSLELRGRGDGFADFLIGAHPDSLPTVTKVLKSAFGLLDARPYGGQKEEYRFCAQGVCTPAEDAPALLPAGTWLDDAARIACTGRCRVCLGFFPAVQGEAWLTAQIRALDSAGEELRRAGDPPALRGAEAAERECRRLSHTRWMVSAWVQADERELQAALQAVVGGAAAALGRVCHWDSSPDRRIGVLLSSQELPAVAAFPTEPFPGLQIEPLPNCGVNVPEVSAEEGIALGSLIRYGDVTPARLRIPYEALRGHACVFGVAGAGKTNTVRSLLSAPNGVPFLVLEPYKRDYRNLPVPVQVCTLKAGTADQLAVNPFWFPSGGSLQYHMDSLKTILSAALEMDDAMTGILEQCIARTYAKLGWDVVTGHNYYDGLLETEKLYPTFSLLYETVEEYFRHLDFGSTLRTGCMDILLTRLARFTTGVRGVLLNRPVVTPVADWVESGKNLVIELEGLTNEADKVVVMAALLSQYFQYVKYHLDGKAGMLRHLFVLEDARCLFPEGGSSARQALTRLLRDQLRVIRGYGEGFVLVEQSPTRLSGEVLRDAAVTIVHRLALGRDLELLRGTLLYEGADGGLGTLMPGQALVRFGGMKEPVQIQVDLCGKAEAPAGNTPGERKHESLADHFLDMAPDLRGQLSDLMHRLYNQIIFDEDADSVSDAILAVLRVQVEEAVRRHTMADIVSGMDLDGLLLHLITRSFADYLKGQEHLGYCLRSMVQMYAERILRLTAGGRPIRRADWQALLDYRRSVLDKRFLELYSHDSGTGISLIRRSCGVTPHIRLMSEILAQAYDTDWMDCEKEQMPDFLKPILQKQFLRIPKDRCHLAQQLTDGIYDCLQKMQ